MRGRFGSLNARLVSLKQSTDESVCVQSEWWRLKEMSTRKAYTSHTHSVTHTHTETWIRCEFRFDLTNRKSFILHTQGRPCQLCFSHARTWNCFLLDALRFRQLSSSLSTSLWFPAALRPSSQWDLCAFCIFLCAPLKVLDKNGPSSEVKSSRGEASRGVSCRETRSIFIARLLWLCLPSHFDFYRMQIVL